MIQKLTIDFIKQYKQVVILPHTMPDGDTIGSCVALHLALKQQDVKSSIVLDDPLPEDIAFFSADYITSVEDYQRIMQANRLCICVDMSNNERLRDRHFIIDDQVVVNIDHHRSNSQFGSLNIVDSCAAATAEIIFRLLMQWQTPLTPQIAKALYVGIVTDTGNFKYASTTANTMRIAAALFEVDFDRQLVMNQLYHNVPRAKMALHADSMQRLRYFNDQTIALCMVSLADLAHHKAPMSYTDGLVESVRDIAGVQMVILLKEVDADEIKVSMRSLGDIDVSVIAVSYGGGGHKNAAGFSFNCSLEQAKQIVEEQIVPQVVTSK